nr:HlyD family efflux transporter periplasmic adaptor subunit [Dyella sp. ASV24]
MDGHLFRLEAVDARRRSHFGNVRLATPLSHSVWAIVAAGTLIIVCAWLVMGHYTRREHVNGALVPKAGLINLSARGAGTVTSIQVADGSAVHAGDPILVLSGELSSVALGDTDAHVSDELRGQAQKLDEDAANALRIAGQQEHDLQEQQRWLKGQLAEIDQALAIQRRQVESDNNLLEHIRPLVNQGYVSKLQIQDQETQATNAEVQVKALARERDELTQQFSSVGYQLQQLPLATLAKVNDLHRQHAQVSQQLAQNEVAREMVIRAPKDGVVSALLVKPGQTVSAGQGVATIVPAASPLEAELWVPSSAIGFVHRGVKVTLHYQAFPYQKFGVQHGVVDSVSPSALTPAEMTSLLGQAPPAQDMYRVHVAIDSQTVRAYGSPIVLKPGMAIEASLLLDRRRLVEWIFEPLYGMRQRDGGIW